MSTAELKDRLIHWCQINSGSRNRDGLRLMRDELMGAFAVLGHPVLVPLPDGYGDAFRIVCRPEAPVQILLGGHYDTVYEADHPFQLCDEPATNILRGPGVADMKGGLLVMLEALRTFESWHGKEHLGWEILITPDEEIGSPQSAPLWTEAATRFQYGLIFEPALPGGHMSRTRPANAIYTLTATGKSAHVGRDFANGRNAIFALSEALLEIERAVAGIPGAICSAGLITGGGPLNVVPDHARAEFNIRYRRAADAAIIGEIFAGTAQLIQEKREVALHWDARVSRPAKEISPGMESLFAAYKNLAGCFYISLDWRDTGGCSDGNNLAAAGLPNLDNLGVRGGAIHSAEEYVELDSLLERATLATLLLQHLAEQR